MAEPEVVATSYESTFLHGSLSASVKLERARTELLDLSARNRLLNIPRSAKNVRTIEVIDEKSSEVFRLLIKDGRAFTFLSGRASEEELAQKKEAGEVADEEINNLAQPEDETVDERGVLNRHADTKLQTRLTSKGLQKRLLDLYFDARTLEEEQGVNILFLALGTLKWVDPLNAKNVRYAPLILIPVSLERGNAAEQFKLKWRQEDHAPNLSLEAFLERVHKLKLPSFEAGDDFDVMSYLDAVSVAIKSKENWSVNPDDIVLGFFSFSKFLMYRDLDPEVWPIEGGLTAQPLIKGLLSDGFEDTKGSIPEDAAIDEYIAPAELLHIVDCDGSQTLAVHDVRAGRNLVIQGPPGTGKSQTIANVIASAIADGKTVLFVAEKMAALEVVKRRLDQAGVGDACLELHSNKANKRTLLEELRRTSELGAPRGDFATTVNIRLEAARSELNNHAARMHKKHPSAELTPYQVIGQLSRLRQEQVPPLDIQLERPETWSADDKNVREELVIELAQRIAEIGRPDKHPWRGVGLTAIFPTDVERLVQRISKLKERLEFIASEQTALALSLKVEVPAVFKDLNVLTDLARRVAEAPKLSAVALVDTNWETDRQAISQLIDVGTEFANLSSKLESKIFSTAWTTDVRDCRALFGSLPREFGPDAFERATRLHNMLPRLLSEAERLKAHLGFSGLPDTFSAIAKIIQTGERVAAAPDVSAEVFAASVWDHGVEQAGDLAEAVATLEQVQRNLKSKVVDAAWVTDFSVPRQVLAIQGNSLFRFLKGDWRRANALVKAMLKEPNLTLISTLEILDEIAIGQKAMAAIQAGDAFGRAAFGVDWRSDRSTAVPLRALVEWMRSLRGLGAEPRLIAGKLPDRSIIGNRVVGLQNMLDEARPLLQDYWIDYAALVGEMFPNATGIEYAPYSLVLEKVSELHDAHQLCMTTMSTVPSNMEGKCALLDLLLRAQESAQKITDHAHLGAKVFDVLWKSTNSDWAYFQSKRLGCTV